MNITCLVFAIIFLVCSFIFLSGKGYVFIPNWNKLSDEDKKDIPLDSLSQNMGIAIACCALILFASALFSSFREHYFAISMVLWLIGCGIDVYFIEKKYKTTK